jgi:hypothetical protein
MEMVDAVQKILPGSVFVGKIDDNIDVYKYDEDRILVSDSYSDLERFIDRRFSRYFNEEPQQALYLFGYDSDWKQFVNKGLLTEWLTSNFDKFTSGRFIHSEYKDLSIVDIKNDPVNCLIVYCDGDMAKVSEVIYPFLTDDFIPELMVKMDAQIFEHYEHYFALMVDLPKGK